MPLLPPRTNISNIARRIIDLSILTNLSIEDYITLADDIAISNKANLATTLNSTSFEAYIKR